MGFNVPKAQRHWSFSANGSFNTTRNSIGNVVTYNESTGGRITRPENINGNWGANGGVTFNIALDTLNRWDVSGSVNGNYRHQIGYVNLNRTAIPDRNVTHTFNLSPSASLSFRNSWLNFSLNGNATYAHTENKLQASRNLSTWNFSYGEPFTEDTEEKIIEMLGFSYTDGLSLLGGEPFEKENQRTFVH